MSEDHTRLSLPRIRSKVLEWGKENYQSYPWRETTNPWHALLAEVMLQRTNATHVLRYYDTFVKRFPNHESLIECGDRELEELVRSLGPGRRVRILRELAEYVDSLDMYPCSIEGLTSIYGVGHYTAAAYLSLHRNVRAVLVDANVSRWLSRLTGKVQPKDVRHCGWLWDLAEALTPAHGFREYNYAVLDFTMKICGRKPKCEQCPMKTDCAYQNRHAERVRRR